jgi:hypothetical protein
MMMSQSGLLGRSVLDRIKLAKVAGAILHVSSDPFWLNKLFMITIRPGLASAGKNLLSIDSTTLRRLTSAIGFNPFVARR